MPISHQSIIHQPIGYTAPVDLNLLGKVLQYKQSEYDAGVAKEQQSIDSIASLDVARDEDRQYLNTKLSNLVSTVNNIGGADFSDPNVTNQIAGLSSQIYGDKNIVDSVAKTKQFRYVQNAYQTLKEKKPDNYNPANEWYDMKKFSSWLGGDGVNPNLEAGAGKVTPYNKYEQDWSKLFDKIASAPNVSTEITDKGLMYRIDTHKVVSPDRIWETASKLLTPGQRQQLAIEGRYTYENVPIDQITKAYDVETYNKVGAASKELEDYKAKKLGATALSDQEKYDKLITEKTGEINTLLAPIRKNADQIKENLYLGEKLKGLQARYSFDQATTKLQSATDKMFVANYQYRAQNDQLNREEKLAKDGLMYYTDPLTGQRTVIADPNAVKKGTKTKDGVLDYSNLPGLDNSGADQSIEFTKNSLNDRKAQLVSDNDVLFRKFASDLGRKKGLSDVLISELVADGHLQAKVSPEIQKAAQEMMDSWNAMTRGEKINYDSLDPMFKNFAGKYQENLAEVASIDKYYNTIDKQIAEKYNITGDESAKVTRFDALNDALHALDKKYPGEYINAGVPGAPSTLYRKDQDKFQAEQSKILAEQKALGVNPDDKRIKAYFANRDDERNTLISASNVRYNLPTVTTADDKGKNLAKMISGNANTLQVYNEQGKDGEKTDLNPDNIEVISKGYSMIETADGMRKQPSITFRYKTGTDKFKIQKVPLNPAQAQVLGFGSEVQDLSGYGLGLHLNGEVNNINTTSGKNYDLKYDLVKYNVEDQNDPSVFIRVKKGDNVISLYNNPFPTYQHAIQFMEGATKQKSADEAFQFLDQMSK